jgi:hypothetical protein
MKMTLTIMMALALSLLCFGCERLFTEGMGEARGASGKVVETGMTPDLRNYKSLHIESITMASGSQTPAEMPDMIQADLKAVAEKRGLMSEGEPGLRLSGVITQYETSSTLDTAIGPLAEVIVQAKLTDTQSGNVVAEANLIGRSKASSSSNVQDLSAGVGKALDQWLKDGGLK